MKFEYIKTLNDNDILLVKTSLLLYLYDYYDEEGLLDDNLKSLFENIINNTQYNNFVIEPPYFKIRVKFIKILFANAPTGIFTDSSFKEDNKVMKK